MKLTNEQMDIMCNILAAVETGGQIYGKGRWDDFTEAGKNTSNEKAITIGCYQFYGNNAKTLLNKIRTSYPAKFKLLDTEKIANDLDTKNWSSYKLSKSSKKAKCIQKIIGSTVGIATQKALMAEQITTYINRAATEGVTSVKAAMFCANIQHLGGKSAVQRIIKNCGTPLTIERLFSTLAKDQKDTSNDNQVGDKLFWSRHVKVYGWIQEKVEEDVDMNTPDKVINIALGEVGYLEKKSNKNLDSKTANAGSANYTKYGRDMHNLYPSVMDFPASWCDAFVDWCFYKAYGVSNAKALIGGNFDDYTPNSAQLYKNKGAWGSTPKYGAQIFFTNGTRICHTGLVYDFDSKYVYTVEGNTSGASGVIANGGGVCKKKYLRTNSRIAGYGYPKYDTESTTSKTKTETKKPVTSTVKANTKVKKGQAWLNDNYGDTLKKYCGAKLEEDGVFGEKSKAGCVCVWKDVANRKYGCKLTPSNSNFLTSCKKAAAKALIREGDSGTFVMIAKTILAAKGYFNGTMNVKFDKALGNAVEKYQEANGLSADRIIGAVTWYKLFN